MTVGSITSPATLVRFNGLAAALMIAQGQRDTAIRLAIEAAQLVWLGGMQPEQYSSAEGLTLTLDVLLGLAAEWAHRVRVQSASSPSPTLPRSPPPPPPPPAPTPSLAHHHRPHHPLRLQRKSRPPRGPPRPTRWCR